MGTVGRKASRALLVGVIALAGLPATSAAPAAAAEPRPVPDPVEVSISTGGFVPAVVTLAVGQSVEFTNDSGAPQTVTATDGAFDSGTIPPGGGFTMAIGVTGTFSFASANTAAFTGMVMVGLLDLPGTPGALVSATIPLIAIPPIADMDQHPAGIYASRSRALVMFKDGATVADANDALADAGVTIVATIPSLNAAVVQVLPIPATGDFAPLTSALATVRAHPAVAAATMDKLTEPSSATMPADSAAPTAWAWDDGRGTTGSAPVGTGDNWGLESARVPSTWNLLDGVRTKSPNVQTVIYDHGFEPTHPDLKLPVVDICRGWIVACTGNPSGGDNRDHGTHVAGTIGATFDNAGAQPGTTLGVSGVNPVAKMAAVSWKGNFVHFALGTIDDSYAQGSNTSANWAAWTEIIDQKKPDGSFPNLRAVNMSGTTMVLVRNPTTNVALWGANNTLKRCGPGLSDDAGGTGPCTPNTLDGLLAEVANDGVFARRIAERASSKDILLSIAAANDSNSVCADSVQTASPANGACPAGFTFVLVDTRLWHAFGWANANWQSTAANPILMVEAVDITNARAGFSNIGGDVSAPGVNIWSTFPPGRPSPIPGYNSLGGTSMAAPHVTGLAGWLAAYKPSLSVGQIKAAIVAGARSDTTGGAKPRIDAYSSFLIVGALADLADVNDPSADGNRRIIRSRTQTETVDTNVGATVGGAQLHSAPDGKVDMRDFRRFRDALLQTCSNRISVPGCPPVGTETMDGANNHPKNDLNYDGCVFPTACRTEEAWSRFDLNGDGMVTPNRAAPVPLGSGGADVSLSDMEMFARVFQEPSEGWNRNDLATLLRSGDLEVHADTMFQAGATGVTIEVRYGASGSLAPGPYKIDRRGGSVIVTVPTVDAGTPVEIIGRATVDGKPLVSALKKRTLKHGEDARIDVCVPVINVTTGDPTLYADGKDKTKVHGTFVRCDGDTVEAEHMSFKLETEETAPLATLSAPTAETNESGRATVEIAASTEAETVTVLAEITIVGSATTPPQVIRGKKEIPITNPPRMIYKWEQVTSDWNVHGEANVSAGPGGGTIHRVIDQTSIGPVTIGRTGHLTPYDGTGPGSGNDRASVRVSEVAGPSAVDYASVITETPGGTTTQTSRLVIPTSSDEIRNELLSPHILDFSEPSGRTRDVWELPNTFMDITDGTIVVNNVSHVSALHYRYASNESVDCQAAGFGCDTMFFLDQVGLTEREEGSAFQVAPDLRAALTFTRKPDNTWSTYRWCGAPQTFDFAPRDLAAELYKQSGTATSKFRFVATITTDPDMTEADLTLPDPTSCITEQKPPVAAIARDFVTAKEGQVVKFLDASSDPNSDVDRWHWDFGDGATSDEQFPTHRFGDDGSYRVTLTVTDAANLTDRTDITVDVVNVAPTVGADDINVASGDSVELAVRLFDPGERDQEALTLKKSFGGEAGLPVYVDQTIPAGSLHINLGVLPDGHHELTLTAVDKDGASSASVTVAIDVGEGGTVEPDEDIEVEAAPGCDFGVKLDTSESDFVDLVTQYRVENSLYRVYPSPTLTQAAEDFAEWLRDNDLFQHEGPGGNSPKDRAEDAEYPGLAVGENLARGPRSAPNVMVGWQVSDPHNVNMLDGRWHAIGISKLDTPRGPLWVTVYGDVVDCPDGPPDLAESFSGASLAPRFRLSDLGETEVLGWRTAEPAAPTIPITAFTVSDTTPATGATVAVGNRSSGSALFQPGDGQLPYTVAAGATAGAVYLDPGTFSMSMMLGSRVARIAVDVGGVGRTVEITPLGPPGAAFGARPTVRAMVATAGGEPVANRTVEFTISGQSTAGVTDATGTAAASLLVDFLPGLHTLTITVPALPGGTDVSTTTPFTVTPNALPVATLNGPYDVLIGSGLAPDLSGSFDPDGVPLANVTYDLNGDGIFGDFFGFGLIPADVVREQICGGTCTPGVDKTIRARVIDVAGGQAEASALVRFTRDFLLSITPGTATVNPGGSISFQVGVITTSGFAQPVALTAPDLPVGVTATFSPAIVTPTGTSILTLTAALSAPSFDTPFTVRGTSGAVVHDATSVVNVEFGLIPQCFGTIDVHVVDKETGAPIANATIVNYYPVPKTDASGNARVETVQLGAGNSPNLTALVSDHPDYWPAGGPNVLAACGAPNTTEIKMVRRRFGAVEGRVVVGIPDPDNHGYNRTLTPTDIPVPGANVQFFTADTTDDDGRFTLTAIPMTFGTNAPQQGYMQTFLSGWWTEHTLVTVHPDATTSVTVPLVERCAGAVDVRVLDATTRLPVADARIDVGFEFGSRTAQTGTNGRARLEGIGLGTRNSAVTRYASATATRNGVSVSRNGTFRLEDCGSLGVTDILLPFPVERRASIRGTVTDLETGDPIGGAYVNTGVAVTTTGPDGTYAIDNMLIGFDTQTTRDIFVAASPPGPTHLPNAVAARLIAGETIVKDVALTRRRTGSLDVTVTDALTGEPIAGANLQGPDGQEQKSGPDGTYLYTGIFTNNVPASVSVFATVPGYWFRFGSALVTPDETAHVDIKMIRECAPATITGRVFNAVTSAPLEGAYVRNTFDSSQYVFTDAGGRFTLGGIRFFNNAPFAMSLSASKEGFLPATKVVQVFCGARISADFGAPDTGHASLSGIVTEAATGDPVVGASVGTEWGAIDTTDAAGAYAFDDVPMGGEATAKTWHVDAIPPAGAGLVALSKDVTVHPNEEATLDFALGAPTNRRPVVQEVRVTVPSTTTFVPLFLTGTDPDGDTLRFRMFTPTGGNIDNSNEFGGVNFSLAAGVTEGRYWYTATDGKLDAVPAEVIITRGAPIPNVPPTATITGLPTAPEGATVNLTVTGNDTDGFINSRGWDTDGDGEFDDGNASTRSLTRDDDAVVTVKARVTDDDGATGDDIHVVTFTNVAPTVAAFDAVAPEAGQEFFRSAAFADPGNDDWTATVDWGDGAGPQPVAVGAYIDFLGLYDVPVSHSYAAAGLYTITIEVCDDDGGCHNAETEANVAEPPPPAPVADISVSKHHEGDFARGGRHEYVVEVVNAGPDSIAGVQVGDTIPAGMTLVSATGGGWDCANSSDSFAGCIRDDALGVGPAPLLHVVVDVDPSVEDDVVNYVYAVHGGDDPDGEDNQDEDPTHVVATPPTSTTTTTTSPSTTTSTSTSTTTTSVPGTTSTSTSTSTSTTSTTAGPTTSTTVAVAGSTTTTGGPTTTSTTTTTSGPSPRPTVGGASATTTNAPVGATGTTAGPEASGGGSQAATPAATSGSGSSAALPRTGGDTHGQFLLGLVMVAAGLVLIARRRRTPN